MPALLKLPNRPGKSADMALAAKSKVSKTATTSTIRGGSLVDRIERARVSLSKTLGDKIDKYRLITSPTEFHDYITAVVDNGKVAIDTETNSKDPTVATLVGISMYTPGQKAVYIPFNHISYVTNLKCDGQMPMWALAPELERLNAAEVKTLWHNAPFDVRVLLHASGVRVRVYFDCYIAARCLNENEPSNKLKDLHSKYCSHAVEFTFDELFEGMPFDIVPINVGYVYAANDALDTFELYDFQIPYLTPTSEVCIKQALTGVADAFWNIEMPQDDICIDLEEIGVHFDFGKADELHSKYTDLLEQSIAEFNAAVESYRDKIDAYNKSAVKQFTLPVNFNSSQQMAILYYDIIGEKSIDKNSPRGTGEKIVESMENSVAKMHTKCKKIEKLLGTYIDKLPNCVSNGRVHCRFNSYGAETGRYSSSEPNLQNIPSKNHDIRQMFTATPGHTLMSSDFSQQEPKALAALCRADGDSQMYDVFMAGKDLYSEIASKAFNKSYEDCREFYPDGTTNKEGKERRSQAKSILLGVLYGRGIASIAEQLKTDVDTAKEIKESVFRSFPAIKRFEAESIKMAEELGYVTTIAGRKRRLPDMQKPDYEVYYTEVQDDDPLNFDSADASRDVPDDVYYFWVNKMKRAYKGKWKIIDEAKKQGIEIIDNTFKKPVTQVVNARIQGSAADLTKVAMIALRENERLRELGFRMLIPVHDEVIAECPDENLKECVTLFADTMCQAAQQLLDMPIKCDVACSKAWYGEEITV